MTSRLSALARSIRASLRALSPYLARTASDALLSALAGLRSLGPLPAVAGGLLLTLAPGPRSGLCLALLALLSALAWRRSPSGHPGPEMLAIALSALGASAAALLDFIPDARLAIASAQGALGALLVTLAWRRPTTSRVRVRWTGEIRVEEL